MGLKVAFLSLCDPSPQLLTEQWRSAGVGVWMCGSQCLQKLLAKKRWRTKEGPEYSSLGTVNGIEEVACGEIEYEHVWR